jgi:hypothetical protein
MSWVEGLVVEVLVNCVASPKQTEEAVKLAEGLAKTSTSVVELFVAVFRLMVQV